ncbi:GRIP and coiled-coil domain-containing protein 2 [Alosa pseudoharengus]|uniref:GRIP and coiled-coil domain-containing protein 2 n=1 Tax=Alosa pseudoharengus TaxID=34774 RepID=UPI003F8B0CA9
MEQEPNPESITSPSGQGPGKSKLDTLSKEDLIKFAKKQIALMQRMKSKCSDLEKEVDTLKAQKNSDSDDSIIKELTERMDMVLLEKAETQQSLVLLRKENESVKKQAQDYVEAMAKLQEKLDQAQNEHSTKLDALQKVIQTAEAKHREDLEKVQQLMKDKRQDEQKNEKHKQEEIDKLKTNLEEIHKSYEDKITGFQKELEVEKKKRLAETERLREDHLKALSESHRELEDLQGQLANVRQLHEEEVRDLMLQLEENAADFEMERERLLSLQDELSEQLAMKENYLQDVQEEEEDPNRHGALKDPLVCKMLNFSGADDQNDEVSQLKANLEDLQAQNTLFQDELTYLRNVKIELESDLNHVRQEFQLEKEELEFKIDELQMTKDDGAKTLEKNMENLHITNEGGDMTIDQHEQEVQDLKELQKTELHALEKKLLSQNKMDKETLAQEMQALRNRCEQLSVEKNCAIEECKHTQEILTSFELELGEKTGDFLKQYDAMKEQSASTVQDLQEKLRVTCSERDSLLEQVGSLQLTVKSLEDLKISSDALQKQNEEVLYQLHQKETAVVELNEILDVASSDKNNLQQCLETAQAELAKLREDCDLERSEKSVVSYSFESISKEKEGMQCRLDELSSALESALTEKESIGTIVTDLKSKLSLAISEKDEQRSHLEAALEELAALQEKGKQSQDLINNLKSEAISISNEERDKLQKSLQIMSDEQEALKMDKNAIETKLSEAYGHIMNLLEQNNWDVCTDDKDLAGILDAVIAMAQQEKLDLTDRVAELTEEMERFKQQSAHTQVELQAHVEDLSREKSLLKGNLDEVVSDVEALQRDLSEMKTVNEKIRVENQELLAQIAEASEKLSAREHDGTSGGNEKSLDEIDNERKELQQLLTEKDSLLKQLSEDMAILQKSTHSDTTSEESMKEYTEKIAILEKESKEKDERMNKIKVVALKARKELDSSKKEVLALKEEVVALQAERDRVSNSMKDIIHGAEDCKNLMMDYDKQTELLDKEREKLEGAEKQIGDLTKRLQTAMQQHEQFESEREDLKARLETLQTNVRQLEAQALEMHKVKCALEKDLEGERLLKEQKVKEHVSAVKEVEELQSQLRRQKQQLQQTAQELEQLRRDAQQSTLLDMEMADYERLVKELNSKITEKDTKIEDLGRQLQTQKTREESLSEEIESLKSQVDQGEEKSSKMKQLLVKTKKDLADAKKNEASQMLSNAALKGELEAHQQQLEDYKIQCSELTAERHRLQGQLKASVEQHQRTSGSYQLRLTTLQEECSTAKAELAATTSEFESYKVRVHNVLKQQKNKSSAQNDSDVTKQEREHMESMLEQLTSRLQDTQHSLQASSAELQQLQTEHDTLLERHNKILQETVVKEAELRERLLTLQSENMALKAEHAQTVSQLSSQADVLRSSFREQLRHVQDEHRGTVETLQRQLGRLENQLFQLQKESSASSTPLQQGKKLMQERRPTDLPLLELQSMAREEGEGMETTETESVSSAGTPLPSLEQLLSSPDPKHEPFVWQVEPTKEELTQKLNTATRSMEHMNGLLHETEATNAILMEQITLLKSEVRRLERNQEREKSVANLEYLKNVLLQFIFLRSGSERQALLPVIHTMLQLSPEEKSKLAAIAQGEEEADRSRGSGWSSYLHSWSGIR